MDILIKDMSPAHIPQAAQLWHQGWIDGHAEVVPAELTKLRTLDSFQIRTKENLPFARAALDGDNLLGFTMVKHDELYQMYVGSNARGNGVAQRLLQDGEQQIRAAGYRSAWLSCAIGNERAARFYVKQGWSNVRVETVELETLGAPFPLQTWRFEKGL
jgi:GNAT superfamily N-acetyltransferase